MSSTVNNRTAQNYPKLYLYVLTTMFFVSVGVAMTTLRSPSVVIKSQNPNALHAVMTIGVAIGFLLYTAASFYLVTSKNLHGVTRLLKIMLIFQLISLVTAVLTPNYFGIAVESAMTAFTIYMLWLLTGAKNSPGSKRSGLQ